MTKSRSEVPVEDRWNVEAIFSDLSAWKETLNQLKVNDQLDWSKILAFKGKLAKSADTLKQALDEIMELNRKLSLLYTWAHLKHDEDITHNDHKVALNELRAWFYEFQQQISWFDPELIALSEETQKKYLKDPLLKDYAFHLEKIFRLKKHTLPPEQEELLALAQKALQTSPKAFSAINDADFKFPPAKDSTGTEHPITHAHYQILVRNQDRTLRENTFKTYHGVYHSFENTLSELIDGAVQKNVFNAKARHFDSSLDAALFPNHIDTSVYHALIQAVRDEIDALHDYYELRKEILKLKNLHLYDMMVPLTPNLDIKMPYHQAEETIIEAFAPLGSDYQNILKKGLKEDKWVDRYENKNKRSGAYSSGSYDTQPYILMNYKDILRDVFTLAHEAGHSMHSFYSNKNQPYHYGDYSIFLAEVASTFNEELLTRHLIKNAKNTQEKIFLINQKLEDIRGTLFRQTMFAEFELKIHTLAEQNTPLTPQLLKEEYLKLNQFYYGKKVNVDQEIEIEWARIPHFYYNFYVFQYATGISAALALANRVCQGKNKEREDYLGFLKSGCSLYPLETLKRAGVDMHKPEPVKAAIQTFRNLTQELRKLAVG